MKKSKVLKVILIILGVLGMCFVLFLLYILLMVKFIFKEIKTTINNNKIEYKLDYQNKLSEDGVKNYVKENLQNKYNESFEIVKFKKANIEKCKTGLDNYRCDVIFDDGYEYDITMKSNNNIYFMVSYSDAYYSKSKNDKQFSYHDNGFNDNYNYMKEVNVNSEFNAILESVREYAIENNLGIKDIYYITDEFFENSRDFCAVNLEVDFNNELNITKELYVKIEDYYHSKLEDILTHKYYVVIKGKKFFLQRSDLIVNDEDFTFYR